MLKSQPEMANVDRGSMEKLNRVAFKVNFCPGPSNAILWATLSTRARDFMSMEF